MEKKRKKSQALHQGRTWQKEEFNMKQAIWTLLKVLLVFVVVLLMIGFVLVGFFTVQGYRMYRDAMQQTPIEQAVEQIRQQEDFVPYEQLPDLYIDAVIAVEDHRFEQHGGIDLLAICRAALYDLRTFSFAQGGSTITQQLAKNLFFTQEKALERKFAEVFAAFELESKYSKSEIFELYVNTIYFGSGYYGISDAARGYFGKEVSQLTDAECVLLAGLPNAPSAYAPDEAFALAKQRMRQVLDRMVACEVLTQEQAQQILAQEVSVLSSPCKGLSAFACIAKPRRPLDRLFSQPIGVQEQVF